MAPGGDLRKHRKQLSAEVGWQWPESDAYLAHSKGPQCEWFMKLRLYTERLTLRHRWTIARALNTGGATDEEVLMVELEDSDGVIGIGECAPSKRYGEDLETVRAFLQNLDLSDATFEEPGPFLDRLQINGAGQMAAVCGLDIALLDGAGQKASQPLYDYLGLGFEEDKHVTSFSIGIDSPDRIIEKVKEASNYPILKLKLGHPNDREHLAALRSAAPSKTVRVDGNEAWTKKEVALKNINWLAEDPNVEFVEQPMPASIPLADQVWLKERSPLPLMGDESFHNSSDVDQCARAFDSVNAKLVKTGGVWEAKKALTLARQKGLKTMIGCMIETSVLISAAAHLSSLTDFLDIDGNLLVSNDPFEGVTAVDGKISFKPIEERTGLGVRRLRLD